MNNKMKIYILHGWAYTTDKWEPFLEELKKNGVEGVLLKIPGLTAPLEDVWNLENYIEWLKKVLEKEKDVLLLGHSNGGRIGLAFAEKYPDKVKQLILVDSAGIYHNEFPIRFKRLIFGSVARVGRKVTQSKNMRKLLYKFAREHDYENASETVRKTMTNLIKVDLRHILQKIKTPAVIIWGEWDEITPVKDGLLMKEKLQNAHLYLIKDARHSPQFTHVKEVVEIISKSIKD